jgi:hypothetical protein
MRDDYSPRLIRQLADDRPIFAARKEGKGILKVISLLRSPYEEYHLKVAAS